MNIGGFQPLSLCDYPGTPAAVIFTQGCNWRCPYCHNRTLLPMKREESLYDGELILSSLGRRKQLLEGVVITGGEPTLQQDIYTFVHDLKSMGFRVKLDTNGSQPSILERVLSRKLIDYVAMDIKAPWDKYEMLAGTCCVDIASVKKSIEIISNSGIKHHFRTTYASHFLEGKDIAAIRSGLPAESKHIIQECKETDHGLKPA